MLLRAGIPLSKLDSFRDILEENAYRLTDRRHMFDLVPFILKEEEARIKNDIAGKHLSVIFDGTSRLGEALAVIVRFVGEDWTLEQRLIRMQMLSKSMAGQEIARELISILSVTYGVRPELLLASMRDCASVNNLAMQTVNVVYPLLNTPKINIVSVNHVKNSLRQALPYLTKSSAKCENWCDDKA